jgi:hypothetical protein
VAVDEKTQQGGDRPMKIMHMERGCCDSDAAEGCVPGHGEAGGCCGMTRQFMTKEERRETLEAYREQLKKELTGVEEHLKDIAK